MTSQTAKTLEPIVDRGLCLRRADADELAKAWRLFVHGQVEPAPRPSGNRWEYIVERREWEQRALEATRTHAAATLWEATRGDVSAIKERIRCSGRLNGEAKERYIDFVNVRAYSRTSARRAEASL